MQLNFLVAGANQVIDDMGRRRISTGAAEPLVARKTFDNAARVMNATVAKPG